MLHRETISARTKVSFFQALRLKDLFIDVTKAALTRHASFACILAI